MLQQFKKDVDVKMMVVVVVVVVVAAPYICLHDSTF